MQRTFDIGLELIVSPEMVEDCFENLEYEEVDVNIIEKFIVDLLRKTVIKKDICITWVQDRDKLRVTRGKFGKIRGGLNE